MASGKEQMNYGRPLLLTALLMMALTWGCSIGRVYMGSEIKQDPSERIKIGSTTKGEILSIFGPPDRIQKQYDGDIFVYAYLRKNSSTFTVEEPYFTNFVIFQYTRVQQKKDGLVILFDKDGIVKNFGFQRATQELTTF
jgi:outer membrane protein assembly factor BamE (lipoprotein component of BamABCDE complex)